MARPREPNLNRAWLQHRATSFQRPNRSLHSVDVKVFPLAYSMPGENGSRHGRIPCLPSRPCLLHFALIPTPAKLAWFSAVVSR
jgi:hypothetical protein